MFIKNNFRKLSSTSFVLITALALAGCGDSNSLTSGSDSSTPEETTGTTPEETPTTPEETPTTPEETPTTPEETPTTPEETPTTPEETPATPEETPTAANQPNFLFIITDDQGLDASAQYAYSDDLPNTPVLDQLAAEGIVFDNMWATPSCTTTRGTLLTGNHGVNSGVDTTPSFMDISTLTIQKQLKTGTADQQYANGVFGKWHVAGRGTDLSHPNDTGVEYFAGNVEGIIDDYSNWELTINGVAETTDVYHTTKVTDLAIDWINKQESPWFSWVAYIAPHSPFHLPPTDLHNRNLPGTEGHIATNPRRYFLAAVEAMDTEIGRLLSSIPSDVRDNTIVMVLGDNGTPDRTIDESIFSREHSKGTLYDGGVRVPFVVAGSNVSSRNVRESSLVNSVDIFATLSEAAGIAVPSDIDGISFLPLLDGSGESQREYNYSEYISADVTGWTVRDNDFKLIELADGTRELYDLRTDTSEATNLINQTELYQDRITGLDNYAASIRNRN